MLSAEQWGRMRERGFLQFHPSQRTECRVGQGAGVGDQEVLEGKGKRREEYEQESDPRADEEAVLSWWT